MDVKDYSQKLDQARDKYRMAQDDLRSSYDKSTGDMKETFENKISKQSQNYDAHKSKLEDQNLVSNELYSDKTKQAISERQEAFRNDIKKNSEKFDLDRNVMKTNFNDKLSNLSDSYKKSTEENDRFHDQATKTMGERYSKANQTYKGEFDKQIERLDTKTKDNFAAQKEDSHSERQLQDRENQANVENLRASGQEQKFKEVARLRNDNESLRTNFSQERDSMNEQQEARIGDILKLKSKESEEGQKNFANLQQNIRDKSIVEEERVKENHQAESKDLEKKFNEDLRNMQHITNQKIKGGTEVSSLKDENKQLVTSYENRLQASRVEAQKDRVESIEKEKDIDSTNRDKLKSIKLSNSEDIDRHDAELNSQHKKNFQDVKDKNNSLIDRYKLEAGSSRVESEERLGKADQKSKGQLKNQRVEFGKYINTVNNNKMEEISSIKNEYNKDKSNFIEKSKRDFSDEKISMKDEFNHQITLKNDMYERKLEEMEKQTNKIIENYENRIGQIARKAEKEVDSIKSIEEEQKAKESQAVKIAFDSQERQHQMDLGNIRDKYERMIGKDRVLNEQQTNRIVQKYEDQLGRERIDSQKENAMKLGESQAQLERLFKSSELEKETLRDHYEQRMENLKLSSLSTQGNSKKV
ncbi:MAG: hypothetical protein H7281_13140 [Bacteriovorax sp.]|nr:hypothetical protein [Bacteriovorax sp.]